MLGLLAAAFALAAQPAAAAAPQDEIRRAIVQLAGCHNAQATRLAETGTDAPDAIVAAVFAACRDREQGVQRLIAVQSGTEAAPIVASLHDQARQQILRKIAEVRGAPRSRGEGDESLVWGECIGREGHARAGGAGTIDAVAAATRQACAAEEQATRAALTRREGAEAAERSMAALVVSFDERTREIVANARTGAR